MPGTSKAEPSREAIEAALLDEQALLESLVANIRAGRSSEDWSPECRDALARALSPGDASPGEHWKARALRRHLFGPDQDAHIEAPDTPPTMQERRRAERVRSDLAHLVPLRALGRRGVPRRG